MSWAYQEREEKDGGVTYLFVKSFSLPLNLSGLGGTIKIRKIGVTDMGRGVLWGVYVRRAGQNQGNDLDDIKKKW